MSTTFMPGRMFIGTNDDYVEMRPGQGISSNSANQNIWIPDENAGMWVFWVNPYGVPELAFSPESKWATPNFIPVWNADIDNPHRDPWGNLVMQEDGNLVMSKRDGNVSWTTATQGAPGSSLVLHKSGFMGIRTSPDHAFTTPPFGCADFTWIATSLRPFNNTLSPAADIDVAPQPLPAFLKSLNINNTLKSAVSGAIGLVPEVGGILKSVVGILWPDDKPKTLQWDEIREGIKTIAQGLIDEQRAKDLHVEIMVLLELLRTYNQTSFGIDQKGQYCTTILTWFDTYKSHFLENATPWKNVQDFVQLGTLHLTFLHHQYHDWDQIFPNNKGRDTEQHKKALEEHCDQYVAAANKIRVKCLEWRVQQVEQTQWENDGYNAVYGYAQKRYVKDHFRDPPIVHECRFHDVHTRGWAEAESAKYYYNFMDQVDIVYREQLNSILSPTLLWPLFKQEPGTPNNITRETEWTTGLMGSGESDYMHYFNDRALFEQHGPISKIELHGYDRLDGFEVWYGGVSTGLRGLKEASGSHVTLDIDVNKEAIVRLGGNVGQWVNTLNIHVSNDKMITRGAYLDRAKNERLPHPENFVSSNTPKHNILLY
jgi:hypothetical protein